MEKTITITKEQFNEAREKVLDKILDTGFENGHAAGALLASMTFTVHVAEMRDILFGEEKEEKKED